MIKTSKIFVNSQNIRQKTGINILVNPTVGLAFYQNLNKYPWPNFFLLAPRNSGHSTEEAELKHLLNDRTLYSSPSKTDKFASQHSFKFLPSVQPSLGGTQPIKFQMRQVLKFSDSICENATPDPAAYLQ